MLRLAREAFPKLAPLKALEDDITAGKHPPPLHPMPDIEEISEGAGI